MLRSALRQDPDVILVGEMRDQETAEIGLRAAMTGHMVLSTLHTNDAVSTPIRLLDMGAPRYMVAHVAAAGDRAAPGAPGLRELHAGLHAAAAASTNGCGTSWASGGRRQVRARRGCSHCNGTGYLGRTGVYEMLEMTRPVVEAANARGPPRVPGGRARADGRPHAAPACHACWRPRAAPRRTRRCASPASSRTDAAFFSYKGRDGRGELVEGVLEGADSAAVADAAVRHRRHAGGDRRDRGAAQGRASRSGCALRKPRVKAVDLLLFSRQMYTLLKAGVPILRALAGLQESTSNPAFKDALQKVRESLDSGRELSASLQRQGSVFSPFYVAMVYVGETTGRLEEIFLRLFHHLEFQEEMRDAGEIGAALSDLRGHGDGRRARHHQPVRDPAVRQGVRGLQRRAARHHPVADRLLQLHGRVLVGAAAGAGRRVARLSRAGSRTPQGRYAWDRFKLRIPIAGQIVQKATLARFARSFALAIRSGVTAVQGLTLVAQVVDNSYMADRIEKMREGVERGESVLRTAIDAGVFTPVVLQMVLVGEESGSLDDMMDEVADMYKREVEYDLKTLGAQIEPMLIVLLGVLVLILALGVFLPIWDLGRVAFQGKAGG